MKTINPFHNAGLIEPGTIVASTIENMWQASCDKISRADFWVMVAWLAVTMSEPTKTIPLTYQFGRKDNAACNTGAVSVA